MSAPTPNASDSPQPDTTPDPWRSVFWLGPLLSAAHAKRCRREGRSPADEIIIYYDGDCGICDRFVSFCLRQGVPDGIRFATQQGDRYARLKDAYPFLHRVDTVVVQSRHGDQDILRLRGEAVFWIISQFRGPLSWSFLLLIIPLPLTNIIYRAIAATRHRLFPKSEATCPVPTPEQRAHFLD